MKEKTLFIRKKSIEEKASFIKKIDKRKQLVDVLNKLKQINKKKFDINDTEDNENNVSG